jgi:hypothetical protein
MRFPAIGRRAVVEGTLLTWEGTTRRNCLGPCRRTGIAAPAGPCASACALPLSERVPIRAFVRLRILHYFPPTIPPLTRRPLLQEWAAQKTSGRPSTIDTVFLAAHLSVCLGVCK